MPPSRFTRALAEQIDDDHLELRCRRVLVELVAQPGDLFAEREEAALGNVDQVRR